MLRISQFSSSVKIAVLILLVLGLSIVLTLQAAPQNDLSSLEALPTLAAPPPAPSSYDLLHNSAPSTPWTQFAGPGVNSVFGNFAWQELDLSMPGRGLGFAFLRTYNSADTAAGPLGQG